MTRLTKKINKEYYRKDANTIMFNSETDYFAIQKLGKLEDLEEELGCPLDVILKKIQELTIEYWNEIHCLQYDNNKRLWYIISYILWENGFYPNGQYYLKDYQKTWWLKEELDS